MNRIKSNNIKPKLTNDGLLWLIRNGLYNSNYIMSEEEINVFNNIGSKEKLNRVIEQRKKMYEFYRWE